MEGIDGIIIFFQLFGFMTYGYCDLILQQNEMNRTQNGELDF